MRALTVLALLVLGVAGAQAKFCSTSLHNKCLSSSEYCYDNVVYKCASGSFYCQGKGPCRAKTENPVYPGWDRYTCIDNTHFANGKWSKQCAPGTQCWPQRGNQNPCLKKKHRGDCMADYGVPEMGCLDGRDYCEKGVIYRCPSIYRCAGKAPCARVA